MKRRGEEKTEGVVCARVCVHMRAWKGTVLLHVHVLG